MRMASRKRSRTHASACLPRTACTGLFCSVPRDPSLEPVGRSGTERNTVPPPQRERESWAVRSELLTPSVWCQLCKRTPADARRRGLRRLVRRRVELVDRGRVDSSSTVVRSSSPTRGRADPVHARAVQFGRAGTFAFGRAGPLVVAAWAQ